MDVVTISDFVTRRLIGTGQDVYFVSSARERRRDRLDVSSDPPADRMWRKFARKNQDSQIDRLWDSRAVGGRQDPQRAIEVTGTS